jgi:hypothetical protein
MTATSAQRPAFALCYWCGCCRPSWRLLPRPSLNRWFRLDPYVEDKLLARHVEDWKGSLAELIAKGHYAPATCNGWLSILRVILQAAKRELGVSHVATEGLKDFDESEHDTYSEEEPNALLPEEVPLFLGAMQELFPQHYAMVFLGMVTGLRPSSLRPLRRKGPMADVVWDSSKLLVRRSHTLGDEVMNTTKQRVKYSIHLPADAINVLRWHVCGFRPSWTAVSAHRDRSYRVRSGNMGNRPAGR